jgi:hypothetical protein
MTSLQSDQNTRRFFSSYETTLVSNTVKILLFRNHLNRKKGKQKPLN